MIEIPKSERGAIAADLMPDLTPLLDVMFMLLVFFILTANTIPFSLDVDLPTDKDRVTQAVEDPDMLAVTLLADTQGWKINDTLYKEEDIFYNALRTQSETKNNIAVIGDKDVSMEKLMNLMTFMRKHGIKTADIVMNPY